MTRIAQILRRDTAPVEDRRTTIPEIPTIPFPEPSLSPMERPKVPVVPPAPLPSHADAVAAVLAQIEAVRTDLALLTALATALPAFKRQVDSGTTHSFSAAADGTSVAIPALALVTLKRDEVSAKTMSVVLGMTRLDELVEVMLRALAVPEDVPAPPEPVAAPVLAVVETPITEPVAAPVAVDVEQREAA